MTTQEIEETEDSLIEAARQYQEGSERADKKGEINMSETKQSHHTPGPWRLDYGQGIGRGTIYPPKGTVFEGKSLAAAHLPSLYDQEGSGFSEEAFKVSEANARLIAAAPDMLGALKAAWAWFNDEHRDDHAWSLVQAAIAKAEGKE